SAHGLVRRAGERARHVLCAGGLLDGDRVLAREALEPAGEERLVLEMSAVLLADEDDERRPVDPRRRERRHARAETRGRVQEDERRLPAPDRVARGERDDRVLVESEHEPQVVGQIGEERDLRRPGVREDRRQVVAAQRVERRVANRTDHGLRFQTSSSPSPTVSSALSTRSSRWTRSAKWATAIASPSSGGGSKTRPRQRTLSATINPLSASFGSTAS